eukprot:1092308-Amphidinium_carterae.3
MLEDSMVEHWGHAATERADHESECSSDSEAEVQLHLTEEDLYMEDDADPEETYTSYLIAKTRWRKFSGPKRHFRHQRRHHGGPGGPQRFQQMRPRYTGNAPHSSRPHRTYAVHHSNPKGADGQPLRCSHCGSSEHLWRKCTAPGSDEFKRQKMSNLGGKGKGSSKGQSASRAPSRVHFSSHAAQEDEASTATAHNLAFMTASSSSLAIGDASDRNGQWVTPPPPDHSPRLSSTMIRTSSSPRLPIAWEGIGGLPPPKFTEEEMITLEEQADEGMGALRHLQPNQLSDKTSSPLSSPATPTTVPKALKPAESPSSEWEVM